MPIPTLFGQFLYNSLHLALDVAPWLLLGLTLAGLIKGFIPEQILIRWLGGRGFMAVLRAALIGAPLPLCSCGAIPMGLTLHRGGAGRGPTTAFMIGTPGVGIDSVIITYALLGPLMALFRVLATIFSAVTTGLLVGIAAANPTESFADNTSKQNGEQQGRGNSSAAPITSCSAAGSCSCSSSAVPTSAVPTPAVTGFTETAPQARANDPDCGSTPELTASAATSVQSPKAVSRLAAGLGYTFGELLDDITWWLLAGVLLAGLLLTLLPPGLLAQYATGLGGVLVAALVGIPLYFCAQAITPVAAALVLAGASPGVALVLLLAAPITSLATLSVYQREFGSRATVLYLLGIATSAILCGLAADLMINAWQINIPAQISAGRELLPDAVKYPALLVLLILAVRPHRGGD